MCTNFNANICTLLYKKLVQNILTVQETCARIYVKYKKL
nr:MAG TPA: hypothetical protein [Bacteriophage sp.]